MPYLNLDPNYPDHPKTIRLIARLGPTADIFPIRLWAYCARIHPRDGYMKGYTDQEVEAVIKWHGEPGLALKNLLAVGFIREGPSGGYICHDWRDHEGHLESFSRRGKAANKARWGRVHDGVHKASIKDHCGSPPTTPALPALPALPKTDRVFCPPTPEEVRTYCLGRGKGIDPEVWMAHYQANGWKVGRNPMKDWRAAVRTWEKNGFNSNGAAKRVVGLAAPVPGKYDGLKGF